jgi:glucose/arabinose dehydrogenase
MNRNQFLCLVCLFVAPAAARAQLADPIPGPIPTSLLNVHLVQVASGLNSPVWATDPGDDSGRLIIVDQTGQLRVLQNGTLLAQPLLNVAPGNPDGLPPIVALNAGFDERGLLGVAFHPNFANNGAVGFGKFYTYTSEPTGRTADFPLPIAGTINHQAVVREWMISAVNPNVVDPTSVREILRVDEPQSNHNAGALAFGPDNFLHISLGDGGAADDQGNGHVAGGNGQHLETALGKILRIDVNGDDFPADANRNYAVPASNPFVGVAGLDEIFAYGFRNPFRMSFDSGGANQLVVGDVGQNDIEEVDIVTSGQNYGWAMKEGTFLFDMNGGSAGFVSADSPGAPAGLVDPIFQYDHDEGISVIGGFVYRGSALPFLQGKYIFGEHNGTAAGVNARLFVGDLSTGDFEELLPSAVGVNLSNYVLKGFGQDEDGELYLTVSVSAGPFGGNGIVLKLVPEPGAVLLLLLGSLVPIAVGRRRSRCWRK